MYDVLKVLPPPVSQTGMNQKTGFHSINLTVMTLLHVPLIATKQTLRTLLLQYQDVQCVFTNN